MENRSFQPCNHIPQNKVLHLHASNHLETSWFSPYSFRLSMTCRKIINVQLILTSGRPKDRKIWKAIGDFETWASNLNKLFGTIHYMDNLFPISWFWHFSMLVMYKNHGPRRCFKWNDIQNSWSKSIILSVGALKTNIKQINPMYISIPIAFFFWEMWKHVYCCQLLCFAPPRKNTKPQISIQFLVKMLKMLKTNGHYVHTFIHKMGRRGFVI